MDVESLAKDDFLIGSKLVLQSHSLVDRRGGPPAWAEWSSKGLPFAGFNGLTQIDGVPVHAGGSPSSSAFRLSPMPARSASVRVAPTSEPRAGPENTSKRLAASLTHHMRARSAAYTTTSSLMPPSLSNLPSITRPSSIGSARDDSHLSLSFYAPQRRICSRSDGVGNISNVISGNGSPTTSVTTAFSYLQELENDLLQDNSDLSNGFRFDSTLMDVTGDSTSATIGDILSGDSVIVEDIDELRELDDIDEIATRMRFTGTGPDPATFISDIDMASNIVETNEDSGRDIGTSNIGNRVSSPHLVLSDKNDINPVEIPILTMPMSILLASRPPAHMLQHQQPSSISVSDSGVGISLTLGRQQALSQKLRLQSQFLGELGQISYDVALGPCGGSVLHRYHGHKVGSNTTPTITPTKNATNATTSEDVNGSQVPGMQAQDRLEQPIAQLFSLAALNAMRVEISQQSSSSTLSELLTCVLHSDTAFDACTSPESLLTQLLNQHSSLMLLTALCCGMQSPQNISSTNSKVATNDISDVCREADERFDETRRRGITVTAALLDLLNQHTNVTTVASNDITNWQALIYCTARALVRMRAQAVVTSNTERLDAVTLAAFVMARALLNLLSLLLLSRPSDVIWTRTLLATDVSSIVCVGSTSTTVAPHPMWFITLLMTTLAVAVTHPTNITSNLNTSATAAAHNNTILNGLGLPSLDFAHTTPSAPWSCSRSLSQLPLRSLVQLLRWALVAAAPVKGELTVKQTAKKYSGPSIATGAPSSHVSLRPATSATVQLNEQLCKLLQRAQGTMCVAADTGGCAPNAKPTTLLTFWEQLYIQVLNMENPPDSISGKGASDVADTDPCGWSRCLESCLHMIVAALPGTSYAFSRLAQLADGARMESDGTVSLELPIVTGSINFTCELLPAPAKTRFEEFDGEPNWPLTALTHHDVLWVVDQRRHREVCLEQTTALLVLLLKIYAHCSAEGIDEIKIRPLTPAVSCLSLITDSHMYEWLRIRMHDHCALHLFMKYFQPSLVPVLSMFLPSDSMITPLVSARDRHAHETPVTAGETALALAGMSDMLAIFENKNMKWCRCWVSQPIAPNLAPVTGTMLPQLTALCRFGPNTVVVHTCTHLLRLLYLLTRRAPLFSAQIPRCKSTNMFKLLLRIRQPELHRYVLKIFKSQMRFLPKKWRSANMELVSEIWQCREIECEGDDDWMDACPAPNSNYNIRCLDTWKKLRQDLRSTCHNRNCAMRLRWCTQQASVTKLITPNARRNSADNEGGDIDIQIAAEVARMLAVAQEDINVCDFIQAPYRRGWFADTYRPITFELPPSTDALWTTALFF